MRTYFTFNEGQQERSRRYELYASSTEGKGKKSGKGYFN